ncbi:hypothetical protein OK414_28945 [Priestia sp. JV24]|uniref:hypothetical protein n=1 Tax=Priestia TaxID=2800373 RepID=UPI0021D65D90|nr:MULTISPECIES: hypothetical protein [Priestia]MCU7712676.1 hypothetical protein [Priestia megaterium]MCW1049081.1 hypothetical protein [Priestia sp. JV24]
MKKKIFIWGMIGYFSVLFQLLSVQNAQALTQERKVDSTDNFSSSSSEELKLKFNSVYEEAYKLGEEDGYKGKIYEILYANQFSKYTSQEIDWFNIGYIVGYEKGKRKRKEEITFLNEQEKTAGEQGGYQQGLEDYKHATVAYSPPQTPAKSKDWNKGFSLGYTKAIEIMNLSVKAKKDGHLQGLEGESLNMPELYSADEITRKAYEEGFQSGLQEQVEQLKKEYKQEGYKQGYALQALSVPSGLSPEVAAAFEKGYSQGEKQKQKDVKQEGFNAAFTYLTYHSPSAYRTNTRLLECYKEGFQSNKAASRLRKEAYEEGWKLGDKITIPTTYKHNKSAIAMYKDYYELGQKEQKQTVLEIFVGLLVLISGVGAYTLFRRKRSREEVFDLEENAEGVGVK